MIKRILSAVFFSALLLSSKAVHGSLDDPGFSQTWINKLVQSARQDPGPDDKFKPLSDEEIKAALRLTSENPDFEWFKAIYGGNAHEVYDRGILSKKLGIDYRSIEEAVRQAGPEAAEISFRNLQITLPVAYPPLFYGLKNLTRLTLQVAPEGDMNKPVSNPDLCSFRLISGLSSLTFLNVMCPLESFPLGFGLCQQLRELQIFTAAPLAYVDLPDDLFELTNLEKLYMTPCQIKAIPDGIGRLKNLVELNISGNALSEISDAIGDLQKLRVLNVSGNWLTTLPPSITKLSALEELNIGFNKFTGFPFKISAGALPQLKRLNIWNSNTRELPENFAALSSLEELCAGDNPLKSLPDNLHNMQLTTLDLNRLLSTNPLSPVCLPEIWKATSLKRLSLLMGNFGALPQEIGRLSLLTHLNLGSAFTMAEFDPILYGLIHLQKLNVSATGLTVFPGGLSVFTQLEKLAIGHNSYTQLCEVAPDLPYLKELDINQTNCTKLPDWIGQFGELTAINAYCCALSALPDTIGRLTNMQSLNVSSQKDGMKAIPSSIINLRKLIYLNVEDDGVATLPHELKLLVDSGQLNIYGFTGKFSPPAGGWCSIQ